MMEGNACPLSHNSVVALLNSLRFLWLAEVPETGPRVPGFLNAKQPLTRRLKMKLSGARIVWLSKFTQEVTFW